MPGQHSKKRNIQLKRKTTEGGKKARWEWRVAGLTLSTGPTKGGETLNVVKKSLKTTPAEARGLGGGLLVSGAKRG